MSREETLHNIVRLNVGGTRYDVSRDTLERYEDSMLARLISKHWKEGNSDDNMPIFIDRNGRLFEFVLDYLRAGKVYLPPTMHIEAMRDEFDFYGIDADMREVHEKNGHRHLHRLTEKILMQEESLKDLNGEKYAFQTSALVEYEFWKASSTYLPFHVRLSISYGDYSMLCEHENALREGLLDRGLEYLKMDFRKGSGRITVQRTST